MRFGSPLWAPGLWLARVADRLGLCGDAGGLAPVKWRLGVEARRG